MNGSFGIYFTSDDVYFRGQVIVDFTDTSNVVGLNLPLTN